MTAPDSEARRRVLFVDDEPHILEGLEDQLRPYRDRWDTAFAPSGRKALELLKQGPFDVLVTDMRMPQMDGATLLEIVQSLYPGTARVVLSGHADREMSLKAVPLAHQYLSKPCKPEHLQEVIDRACRLQAILEDEGIRAMLGGTDQLPSLPAVYSKLTEALKDPHVSMEEIARIVRMDVAISAKLLKLVNSGFFGLPKRVTNVKRAVTLLGTRIMKDLTLSAAVFDMFQTRRRFSGLTIEFIHRHSFLAARIAAELLENPREAEDAFMAAMLHDVGKLVLAARMPDYYAEVMETSIRQGVPSHEVEMDIKGVTHAQIGAVMLGLWGLPMRVVEAVATHHEPAFSPHRGFGVTEAVHVADCLACYTVFSDPDSALRFPYRVLDVEQVKKLGLAAKMPMWRALAGRLRADSRARPE